MEDEPVTTRALLYAVAVDEIGLDVDAFRLREGASRDRLYFTGIEFALGIAVTVVTRFVRGYLRGARRRLEERGVEPGRLGERLGAGSIDVALRAAGRLAQRSEALQGLEEEEHKRQLGDIERELDELVRLPVLRALADELARADVEHAREEARADIAAYLVEGGVAETQAREIAERVEKRVARDLRLQATPESGS